jgi:two-component system chemotaxis response regulator CheB
VPPVSATDNNAVLLGGHVYLATGQSHLHIVKQGTRRIAQIVSGAPISRHLPSIDATFKSLAKMATSSIGVLLTGMGRDGAAGLKSMHSKGDWTITQSRETCVVYGMPRAAEELKASRIQLAPRDIGAFLSKNKSDY